MSNTPNKKLIGLFTIVGICIFIAIVLMFTGHSFFNKDNSRLVMYFEESISGLIIGSPVSFKGVEIGRVSKIDLMANTKDLNFSIPVFAVLNEEQSFRVQNFKKIDDKDEFLKELIKKGLRARLATQSYLTGQLMIELEMLPNTPIALKSNKNFKNTLEIPTVLSPMGELSKRLEGLPIKEIIIKINNLLDVFNAKAPTILDQTALFTLNLNKLVYNNMAGIPITLNNLDKALIDIGQAARSFKNLADYLERHPEAILKGKGRY